MTAFHDVPFPIDIAFNSEGGPTRRTEIVTLANGREERNSPWANSRRRWNAGYGVKSMADIETVIAFFEARRARLHAFRFRDPFDHQSAAYGRSIAPTDQVLGAGDGARRGFPLVKRYESGPASYLRPIAKAVAGSLRAAVDGVEVGAALDEACGAAVLDAAPAAGAVVTAGFLFDCPARFDADQLSVNLAAFRAGDIPSIPLIEVFL